MSSLFGALAGAADRPPCSDACVVDINSKGPGAQENFAMEREAELLMVWADRRPVRWRVLKLVDLFVELLELKKPGADSIWSSPDSVSLVGGEAVFLKLGTVCVISTECLAYIYAPEKEQAESVGSTVIQDPPLDSSGQASGMAAKLPFVLKVLNAALAFEMQELESLLQRAPPEAGKQNLADVGARAGSLRKMLSELQEKSKDLQHVAALGQHGPEGAQEESRRVEALFMGYMKRCDSVLWIAFGPPKTMYKVCQIKADGSCEDKDVSMFDLALSCQLDWSGSRRAVVPVLSESNPQTTLWLRSAFFLAFGPLCMLCSSSSAFVFDPTSREAQSFLTDWSMYAASIEHIPEFFVLKVVESALRSALSLLEGKVKEADAEVKGLKKARWALQPAQKLETCYQKLKELSAEVEAFRQVLKSMLPAPNAGCQHPEDSGQSATDLISITSTRAHVGSLAEGFLQKWKVVACRVEQLKCEVKKLHETNSQRAELRKSNTHFAVLLGSLVAAIFSMNLTSGLEGNEIAFWSTTASILGGIILIYASSHVSWKVFL